MRNFMAISKKKLKQTLNPYGYANWKSIFYKLEDEIFALVQMKSEVHAGSSIIQTFASPFTYCVEYKSDDFDPREPMGDNMFNILRRVMPDKFSLEYYLDLTRSTSEEETLRNLASICDTLEEFVIPYIQKFADLAFYYREFPEQLRQIGYKDPYAVSEELFGLSVKLRKYDNAVIFVDHKMAILRENMKQASIKADEYKKGNIDEWTLIVQKKKADLVESLIHTAEEAVVDWEKKIKDTQVIKDLLLQSDHNLLDVYVERIERNSREVIRQIFTT